MWSEREIAIAKQLQEVDTVAFLRKVFTELKTQNGEVLEQNIIALDDAEYGRLMKVYYLSRKENKAKLNLIAKVAKMNTSEKKTTTLAPR